MLVSINEIQDIIYWQGFSYNVFTLSFERWRSYLMLKLDSYVGYIDIDVIKT